MSKMNDTFIYWYDSKVTSWIYLRREDKNAALRIHQYIEYELGIPSKLEDKFRIPSNPFIEKMNECSL